MEKQVMDTEMVEEVVDDVLTEGINPKKVIGGVAIIAGVSAGAYFLYKKVLKPRFTKAKTEHKPEMLANDEDQE